MTAERESSYTSRPLLGIDLGASFSCVAQYDDLGVVNVLSNRSGQFTTPSVVYYDAAGRLYVGQDAKWQLNRGSARAVG